MSACYFCDHSVRNPETKTPGRLIPTGGLAAELLRARSARVECNFVAVEPGNDLEM